MAGTLQMPVQQEDINTGSARLQTTTTHALQYVAERGIPIPGPPVGYAGEMPPSIVQLDDNALGELLNHVDQWLAYIDGQLAIADGERASAKATLEFREARIRLSIKANSDKKITVGDKADMATTEPQIVEARQRYLYCEAIYSLMRAARNKAQQNWETVSRRITQRGQESDRGRRESNVAGVPSSARTFRRPQQ